MSKLSKTDIQLIYAETLEEVQQALKNGANVNAREENGWNALMVATQLDIVKALVEAGAFINEQIIEEQKNDEIKQYLKACIALLQADTVEKSEKALNDGAYIDAKDHLGNTSVINTAQRTGINGEKDIVEKQLEFLLNKGADVNAQNNSGTSAIMCVTTKRKAAILMARKANLDITNKRGTSGRKHLLSDLKITEIEIERFFQKQTECHQANHQVVNNKPKENIYFIRPNTAEEKREFMQIRIAIQQRLMRAKNDQAINEILNSDEAKKVVLNFPAKIDDIVDARGRNILIRIASFDLGKEWSTEERKKQIKLLVKCGANINASVKENGETPLISALKFTPRNEKERAEKVALVKLLIELGANTNISYKETGSYITVFQCAKNARMDDVVKEALAQKQALEIIDNLSDNTEGFKIPEQANVDRSITDSCGRTAIMLAAKNKNIEALRSLYKVGAFEFMSAKDAFGKTIWDYAEDIEVKKYIQEAVEMANKQLLYADTPKKIQEALSHGADINTVNITGQNALMLALVKGKDDTVQALLNAGINVNAKDDCGKSALMYVQTKSQAQMLIDAGAKVNAKDNKGYTVFQHIEYIPNSGEIINCLKEYINILNNRLIDANNTDEIKELIEAGADINARDNKGKTALMYALTSEKTKLLLEAGADVNARDNEGKTALMYAKSMEQIKILLKAGADINARDNEGNTIFDIFRGNEDIATFLNDERFEHDTKIQEFIKRRELREKIELYKRTHRILEYKKHVLSGAVIADKIAESIILGKEKRIITPTVGKQIRQELIKACFNQKNNQNK